MFIFIFLFFVLKQAVMILDPLASHAISAFCASFLNKRPTPSECGSSSSSCPEYNINSPVVNHSCPDWVHRVSQSPSTARLNLRISAVTWGPGQFPRFVHCSHVPSADVQSFPGRKKGHWHCGFHRNTSSRTEVLFSFVVHVSVA